MSTPDTIDWTPVDKFPESTIECHCGQTWRSHAKCVALPDGGLALVARRPCPGCGRSDNLRRAASDADPTPEVMGVTVEVCWTRAPHLGFCSLCTRPGDMSTTTQATRIIGRFEPRTSPHGAVVDHCAVCLPCAAAVTRPRELGKEGRAKCLPGVVLKRYRRGARDEAGCGACLRNETGVEYLAAWRDSGASLLCVPCLDGMRATLRGAS